MVEMKANAIDSVIQAWCELQVNLMVKARSPRSNTK